jgi:hypothetical protein
VVCRIIRDYVSAPFDSAKPELERFIVEHVQCPEAVPLVFIQPAASICGIRRIRITPRFRADDPVVDVVNSNNSRLGRGIVGL